MAVASTRNTFTDLQTDSKSDAWVCDDRGAGFFGNTFTHDFEFEITDRDGNYGSVGVWAVSNTLNNIGAWNSNQDEAVAIEFRWANGTPDVYLEDFETQSSNAWASAQTNQLYYCTTERTSASALECRIYTDSARSTTSGYVSISLANERTYRYIGGLVGNDKSNNTYKLTGYTQNLKLNATEDITTYTTRDDGSKITTSTTKADVNYMERGYNSCVYKDHGENNFGGDFTIDFEFYIDEHSGTWGKEAGLLALNNDTSGATWAKMDTNNSGIAVVLDFPSANVEAVRMINFVTDSNPYIHGNLAKDVLYYGKFIRSGTAVTCELYTDSGMTAGIGSATTLYNAEEFRMLSPMFSRQYTASYSTDEIKYYVQNVELIDYTDGSTSAPAATSRRRAMIFG